MKLWKITQFNKDNAAKIAETYELPPLLSTLLEIRGIRTEQEIRDFLNDETTLSNPFLIKDMDKAVNRIIAAVEGFERICIYGDYDADGVTSTALLYSYLEAIGANVMYYIPSREKEGYGMNKEAVNKLHNDGVTLIITVDNGISAKDEIDFATTLGIDTVVTDHHTVPDELPNAIAVVNPNRKDDNSSCKYFSGVGVAFKLVMAIEGEFADSEQLLENYSDICTLGTIGDIVPLVGENRIIVKNGLRHIQNGDRTGIKALLNVAHLEDKRISSGVVSFTIVPRINAGGRLGLSEKSVLLMLTDDENEAFEIAENLTHDNIERQDIEGKILDEIQKKIYDNQELLNDKVIVIASENLHPGVIGIVASRIKDAFGKPAIIISIDEKGIAKGSGRSVEGFSLIDAVNSCRDTLIGGGGHPMAVGIELNAENIDAFRIAINKYVTSTMMPYDTVNIDCKLNPSLLDVSFAEQIKYMEPFGRTNPTPIFGLYQLKLIKIISMSNNKHLRLIFARNNDTVQCLKFNTSLEEFPYVVGDIMDIAVTLDKNTYNNVESLSVIIKHIKPSNIDNEKFLKAVSCYERFCLGDNISAPERKALTPSRDEFILLYKFLKQNNGFYYDIEILCLRIGNKINPGKLLIMLMAMQEQGLIDFSRNIHGCTIAINEVSSKVDLEEAPIIKRLKEAV